MVDPEVQDSYVARIWLEGSSENSLAWRGHVRHVHGEEECYFQELSALRAFLERVSGVPMREKDEVKDRQHEN